MKFPLPFLSLTLLALVTACNIASSSAMPTINVLHANTVGTMLILAGQLGGGYKFTAPNGSYTINFPGKPSEKSQSVQTKLGLMNVLIASYETNGGKRAFFASSTQYNIDPRRYNVQKGLDGARDGIAKSTNAVVSNETKINYKGAPGRQMYLTMKQGKAKVRLYIVNAGKGPTIYQTFVIDTTGKADDAEVNSFLDSLTFKPK